MGFLLTLLLSLVFGVLGAARPKLAVYLLLGAFVFFDEMGAGFTTFRGSFVFNAYFVGFYGLRLIEVLTVSAYIPMVLMIKAPKGDDVVRPFASERLMAMMILVLSVVLASVEYAVTKRVEVSSFRLPMTGMMQFHMLIMVLRTPQDVDRFVRTSLIMLSLKALFGLMMFAAGQGVMSPRGKVPFFWDSKQIEAFGHGVVLLVAYLLNFNALKKEHRSMPFLLAFAMMVVLVIAVGGSIRRTIWVQTFLGVAAVMVLSRRTTIVHYIVVIMLTSVSVGLLLTLPQLEDTRKHLGKYVESMNLLDDRERLGNIENQVHINNVEQYTKMLVENPDMLLLGVHGPSGSRYDQLRAEYAGQGYASLGMAHNGPLRTILAYGGLGLIIYFWLFFLIIGRTWRVQRRADDEHGLKHLALGCGVYLILQFGATFAFVPPFFTSSKGLYYTFLNLFVLGMVARHLAWQKPQTKMQKRLAQNRGYARQTP